jgi:hypothetical protein
MSEEEITDQECFNCGTSLMDEEMSDFIQTRVRRELTIEVLKLLGRFESKEEPTYKELTKDDVIHVLSSIIAKKTV